MELPKRIGYRVEVLTGLSTGSIDFGSDIGYCYQAISECGHIHHTEAAAECCRRDLLAYSNYHQGMCATDWRNSCVAAVYAGYEDKDLFICSTGARR